MEDWLKPETVETLTRLLLPGFVVSYVRSRLLPVKRVELKDAILVRFAHASSGRFQPTEATPNGEANRSSGRRLNEPPEHGS
jgi:hypothetical protein